MSEYSAGSEIVVVEEVYLRDGTRLTETRAAQIAEETLNNLHREIGSEPRRTRRLRSSSPEGPRHSPQVSFRIPEQTRRLLDERARADGREPTDVAREALERYLQSPEQ
ncbi:MAG: ribbon-helix-helix domain-containing protein [Actinomycetota bacterium]|nr:ribbon-helix-helix domain-containing protein [Actinomycetota bacterium]